ncbi:MAG TPA: hypothetical protein GX696_10475 [Pseudomonadaceae bacterium]|nr:hypothetical protein [Pseudomonadaceae bacterium]
MRNASLIAALALLLSWPLQAAEPADATTEQAVVSENESGAENDADASTAPDTAANSTAEADEATVTPAQGDDNFIPSMQISEDLSVSFPTDI